MQGLLGARHDWNDPRSQDLHRPSTCGIVSDMKPFHQWHVLREVNVGADALGARLVWQGERITREAWYTAISRVFLIEATVTGRPILWACGRYVVGTTERMPDNHAESLCMWWSLD